MRAAIYLRLSREDGEKESESIRSQRVLLEKEVRCRKWTLAGEFVDDGVSGLTFQRPGFSALCQAVEEGRVDVVLVKDLSRLGRDYTATGYYLDHYFPRRGIRFLSLGEGIDTGVQTSANDFAPFQSVINDLYARDISRKVRAALAARRETGRFMGSCAPYGYRKGENGRLLPVPTEAAVIRGMAVWFFWGKGSGEIAQELNRQHLPAPGGKPGGWSECAVRRLMKSETLTGTCLQGKTQRLSYKEPRRIAGKPVRTEGAHAAILPGWFYRALQRRQRGGRSRRLCAGQIWCRDCGGPMGIQGKWLICIRCGGKCPLPAAEDFARTLLGDEKAGEMALRLQRSFLAALTERILFSAEPGSHGNFYAKPVKDWEREKLCAILRRKDFAKGLWYGQEVLCRAQGKEDGGLPELGGL